MDNYKDDIRATRRNALGSSDGKILQKVSELGEVPKSAYKRLAVVKGLIEQTEIPYTAAVRTGDEIEQSIFNHLHAANHLAESNPLVVSEKYSRPNCRLLSHPDIRIKDEEKKTLTYIEIKASRYTTDVVRSEYEAQLYIHSLLLQEEAAKLGKEWKTKLFLAHFSTEGLDLENGVEFNPERLMVKQVRLSKNLFDVPKAMDIIDKFLADFNEYYETEEIQAEALPANVYSQFSEVANFLREIKEREEKVDAFKQKLFTFLTERGISKVACDEFSFSVVQPTQSVSFDSKKYLEDLAKQHPVKAKKIKNQYAKKSNRKGYVLIKVNNNNND